MADTDFALHLQLVEDTFFIEDLPLCRLLLMNNKLFPWLILVPRRAGLREITDLAKEERDALMDEIAFASQRLQQIYAPHKTNVAALGNLVEQLHVHVIARFREDAAWPKPVWGSACEPYDSEPHDLIARLMPTGN